MTREYAGTSAGQKAAPGFAVLGEDARLTTAAAALCRQGYCRVPAGQLAAADAVLLGAPTKSLVPFEAQLGTARPGTLLFAGALSADAAARAVDLGLVPVDYMEDEALARFNAIPTAEGALGILLAATPQTLWHAPVLLVGYGRISQTLAPRLLALGCYVTVAARSAAARAQALADGTLAADTAELAQLAAACRFLVNTAPAPLVDAAVLSALPKGAFVLELAGAPGGVDMSAAARLGVSALAAPGLPGRCAPHTAGWAVGHTVAQYWRRIQCARQRMTGDAERRE